MLRRMLIVAAALVVFASAPASATYEVAVNPGEVVAGATVTVTGKGCGPNEPVQITFSPHTESSQKSSTRAGVLGDKLPADANVVATTTTDEKGEYSVSFVVPPGTPPGTYDVDVYCSGVWVAGTTVEVLPATTPTTPGTPGGPIVRTGSDLNGLGLFGAGLLLAGGIILIATKRRRNEARA